MDSEALRDLKAFIGLTDVVRRGGKFSAGCLDRIILWMDAGLIPKDQ